MEEKIKNLIAKLKAEQKKFEKYAQENLDNSDVNHEIEDIQKYGEYLGRAKTLKKIISKLKAL